MGTRADFYVGRESMEWLGSIAWDGYPGGIPPEILKADDGDTYRRLVMEMIEGREDGTKPEMGWPWPWENSATTDYAYTFDAGKVYGSCFGGEYFDASLDEPPEAPFGVPDFPNLKGERASAPAGDKRSGVMLISTPVDPS